MDDDFAHNLESVTYAAVQALQYGQAAAAAQQHYEQDHEQVGDYPVGEQQQQRQQQTEDVHFMRDVAGHDPGGAGEEEGGDIVAGVPMESTSSSFFDHAALSGVQQFPIPDEEMNGSVLERDVEHSHEHQHGIGARREAEHPGLVDPELNNVDMSMRAQAVFDAVYGDQDQDQVQDQDRHDEQGQGHEHDHMRMSDPSAFPVVEDLHHPSFHSSPHHDPHPQDLGPDQEGNEPSSGPSRTNKSTSSAARGSSKGATTARGRAPRRGAQQKPSKPTRGGKMDTSINSNTVPFLGLRPNSLDPSVLPSVLQPTLSLDDTLGMGMGINANMGIEGEPGGVDGAEEDGYNAGPLSDEEIKRRQNRSRASGRVLPRGQACDFCKRRKLRCNAEKPVCDHCSRNPLRVCTYTQTLQAKTKGKAASKRTANNDSKLGIINAEDQAARDADLAIRATGGIPSVPIIALDHPDDGFPGSASPVGSSSGGGWPMRSEQILGQGLMSGDGLDGGEHEDSYTGFEVGLDAVGPSGSGEHEASLIEMRSSSTPPTLPDHGADNQMDIAEERGINLVGDANGTGQTEREDETPFDGSGFRDQVKEVESGRPAATSIHEDTSTTQEGQTLVAQDGTVRIDPSIAQPDEPPSQTQIRGPANQAEPYLMTLANAAEVAGDQAPSLTDADLAKPPAKARGRARTDRSASAAAAQKFSEAAAPELTGEEVMELLAEVEAKLSGADQLIAVERTSDQLVHALLEVFDKRAFFYKFTRPLTRWHAALNGPPESRPSKCLMYAILAMTAASSPVALPVSVRQLPISNIATLFLASAQREFAVAIVTRSCLLDALQACVFLVQTLHSQGRMLDAWLMAGQGVKLAVACGLHRLGSSSISEQSEHALPESAEIHFDFNVVMGEDGMPIMANDRSAGENGGAPVFTSSVLGTAWIIPPPGDEEELMDRIQLFWSLLWFERAVCLSTRWPSALNDADITTPLLSSDGMGSSLIHGEADAPQLLSDLFSINGVSAEVAKRDDGWTYMLKAMMLLYRVQRMLDTAPSPARDAEKAMLRAACEACWASLPDEAAVHPPTGRNKRAFAADHIFLWVARHTIDLLMYIDDGVQSPEGVELMISLPADDPYIELAKNVVRLARTLNSPDYVKPDLTFTILFSYTGTFLAHRSQQLWNAGRTLEAKGVYVLAALVLDTLTGLARHLPLAGVEVERIENIRRNAMAGQHGSVLGDRRGVMGLFVVSEGMV